MKKPTLWFDKDGVLAKYDYSLYEPEFGAPAPWLIRNAHVFKGLDKYENMCEAFINIYSRNKNKSYADREATVKVLTSVSDSLTLSEQVLDSMEWCEKHLGLEKRDFYAVSVPKENVPIELRSSIDKYDVLFDDYMPNLIAWEEKGGTAIKVVNGINSPTSGIPCLDISASSEYIEDIIKQIIDDLSSGRKIELPLALRVDHSVFCK